MKSQFGVGWIPYEIGDTVKVYDSTQFRVNADTPYEITDIRMVQYVKDRIIVFEVQVDGRQWIPAKQIKERI